MSDLVFPQDCIVGSLGDCARILSDGTEIPAEGIYASLLTFAGAAAEGRLSFAHRFFCSTRLYTVIVGQSAASKKSSSMNAARYQIVENMTEFGMLKLCEGVGSGEGLLNALNEVKDTVLLYDEILTLFQKMKIESSSLLGGLNTLYEHGVWENKLKDKKNIDRVEGAHLSLLGCTTDDAFGRLMTREQIDLGLPNRLFIIHMAKKPREAFPPLTYDMNALNAARHRIGLQFASLPRKFEFTEEGQKLWAEWYTNLPDIAEIRRLDNIGLRLLPILCLTCDKTQADEQIVRTLLKILDYALRVRQAYQPLEANSKYAECEQEIMNVLRRSGPLAHRNLQQLAHGSRHGTDLFKKVLQDLRGDEQIHFNTITKIYRVL